MKSRLVIIQHAGYFFWYLFCGDYIWEITAAQNEIAPSYHTACGLFFLVVILRRLYLGNITALNVLPLITLVTFAVLSVASSESGWPMQSNT